jgi:peptide/nickel transport system permease protein
MALFVLTALFAGAIAPFDPTATDAPASLARPGGVHLLGADFMGRDVFSRIVHGARISLAVGLCATALGCLIGVAIGLASGYLGGSFDLLVQRLIDILQSLPLLVMALVMAASLGPSLTNTIVAIAIPLVPNVARIIRSNTLALREMPFVEAARAVGMSEARSRCATYCRTRSRRSSCSPRRRSARRSWSSPRSRSSAWESRSRIPPGAACFPNRRRNTCAPRRGS